MVNLRPTTPEDASDLSALMSAVWNGDRNAVAYHGSGRIPGVWASWNGRALGYAFVRRGTLHPKHLYVGVHVHPDARRQGLGAALWEAVTEGVTGSLKTATYADFPDAVRFLERRGLRVTVETHEPTLDLASLNAVQVDHWAEAARARGYDLQPITVLDGPEARRDLAHLHLKVYAHTHEHDPPAGISLEDAEDDFLGDDLNPAWLWGARRGRELAGVASVRTTDQPSCGELGWFGVVAEHQANGAAVTLALTTLALSAARRDGVREVTAELDSADSNALHLLGALPWERGRVWLTLTSPHVQPVSLG